MSDCINSDDSIEFYYYAVKGGIRWGFKIHDDLDRAFLLYTASGFMTQEEADIRCKEVMTENGWE